jgi:predicted DNA-binding transcriptional regulator YafY
MSQMERIHQIDRLLRFRSSASLAFLINELQVSRATVVRDLAYLRDRLQAPVVWDPELRGYRLDGPFSLPAVYLTAEEIQALLVLHHLTGRLQPTSLGSQLGPLRDLLRRLVGDSADEDLLASRIRILNPGARQVAAGVFQTVAAALLASQRIRLTHYHRSRDDSSTRTVSPQRLVLYRDNWYLDAYCHLRNALRSFALDAVTDAAALDEAALDLPASDLDRELGAGYGIFAGASVRTAELRFSPMAARWVSHQHWHSAQQLQQEPDGSLRLTFPYSHERELLMDILRFGGDVEVLGPPELRQAVSESLEAALAHYREEKKFHQAHPVSH